MTQSGRRIRLFLLDDHAIVREGLRLLLRKQSDMEVVGEAGTVEEALAFTGRADVILADLVVPDARGHKLVAAVRDRHPRSKILVLTMVDNPADVHLSLAAGEGYLQPSLGAVVSRGSPTGHAGGERVRSLSERERDVLRLVALGHTNAEVGQLLGIAQRTVESHRTHILRKLDIRTRAELVRYAAENGILELSHRS